MLSDKTRSLLQRREELRKELAILHKEISESIAEDTQGRLALCSNREDTLQLYVSSEGTKADVIAIADDNKLNMKVKIDTGTIYTFTVDGVDFVTVVDAKKE